MVEILKQCILSIWVYNPFFDRQRNIFIHRNISIHRYLGCLHEIETRIFKKCGFLIGRKNSGAILFLRKKAESLPEHGLSRMFFVTYISEQSTVLSYTSIQYPAVDGQFIFSVFLPHIQFNSIHKFTQLYGWSLFKQARHGSNNRGTSSPWWMTCLFMYCFIGKRFTKWTNTSVFWRSSWDNVLVRTCKS